MGCAEWCSITRDFLQGLKVDRQRESNHAQVEWNGMNHEFSTGIEKEQLT